MSNTVLDSIEKWIGDGRYHPEAAGMLRDVVAQAREANRLRQALEKSVRDWHDGKAYTDILREAEDAIAKSEGGRGMTDLEFSTLEALCAQAREANRLRAACERILGFLKADEVVRGALGK